MDTNKLKRLTWAEMKAQYPAAYADMEVASKAFDMCGQGLEEFFEHLDWYSWDGRLYMHNTGPLTCWQRWDAKREEFKFIEG